MTTNIVYHSDNLPILQGMDTGSIDLVCSDVPFCSGRIYCTKSGEVAFDDRWVWSPALYEVLDELPIRPRRLLYSLIDLYEPGSPGGELSAYLAHMAPRLVECHRVLSERGSIWLHCDPSISPYLRLLLDTIFGRARFRNEVVWHYRRWPTRAAHLQRMHDTILVYARGEHPTFNVLYGYEELAASTLATFGRRKQRADFSSGRRRPGLDDCRSDGPPLSDVWEVGVIAPHGKERTGYSTQKPEALLERVILSASNEEEVVLDAWCGSGTTLAVAARLGRKWIGIDSSEVAVAIARKRMWLPAVDATEQVTEVEAAE